MSVTAFRRPENAEQLRRRLFNPANAVTDSPLEMRNGRPVAEQVIYIEKHLAPVSPQPVVSRGTLLPRGRHLGRAILRGLPLPTKNVSMDTILRAVAAEFGVTVLDLLSHRRTRQVTRPRQIACHLARHMTVLTLPGIGRRVGGRDHTTILAADRVIIREMEKHPDFAERIEALKKRLETI